MSTPNLKLRHVEHYSTDVLGFNVGDYTTPNRENTEELNLIWVGYFSEGRWLTREEAVHLAAAITTAADSHARRLAAKEAAA